MNARITENRTYTINGLEGFKHAGSWHGHHRFVKDGAEIILVASIETPDVLFEKDGTISTISPSLVGVIKSAQPDPAPAESAPATA